MAIYDQLREAQLWTAYRAKPTRENTEALIVFYRPMVAYHVARVARRLSSRSDIQALQAAGERAVWESIGRFDISRGVKFHTFVQRRIRGACLDYVREELVRTKLQDRRKEMPQDAPSVFERPHFDGVPLPPLVEKFLVMIAEGGLQPAMARRAGYSTTRISQIASELKRRIRELAPTPADLMAGKARCFVFNDQQIQKILDAYERNAGGTGPAGVRTYKTKGEK